MVLLTVAVVPLLAVLGWAWHDQKESLLQRAESDLGTLASLNAAGQDQLIEGTRQMLAAVASSNSANSGDWTSCNTFLQRLGKRLSDYVSVGVADADGMLVCRSSGSNTPVDLSDRPYVRKVMAGAAFATGDYMVGRITGNKTIPLALPVRAQGGTVHGVAFVGMDLHALQQRLRGLPLAPGVSAMVTDGRGAILASTRPGDAVGAPVADDVLARALARGEQGALRSTDTQDRLFLHHIRNVPSSEGGMRVAVSAPAAELMSPLTQQLGLFMAVMLGLLAVYAVVIGYLGRMWLLRPLGVLAQSMRQIELGLYLGNRSFPASRVREIRVLQGGLTAMWAGLARRARERDHALAASNAARAEMNAVLNEMDDGFMVLDHQWRIKFCNRQGAGMLSCQVRDMDGRAFWSLFPDDRQGHARSACEREIGAGRRYVFETWHQHYRRWFEIRLFASADGIGVFLRDSTKSWEMIDELRESERRYRELFEANPNVMWIIDSETTQFLAVNAAAVRRYGYSQAEFLAMCATDICPPDDQEQFVEYVQKSHEHESLRDEPGIWRHLTRNGDLMLVDAAQHATSFRGRPALLVMSTDVTTRLAAESQLRRKLERLAARHDGTTAALQASRQILSGYMRMLNADVLPVLRRVQALDTQAPADTERLRRKGMRVGHMVEEVLRLTEIGRMPFDVGMTDLSDMAEAVVDGLRAAHPGRQVHVEIEPRLMCRCDRAMVLPLMQALLDNAWKFSARQAEAWIRVGRAPGEPGSPVPAFFVSDNGIGFDSSDAPGLYKPFVRLHSGAEFPGYGLGLATAHASVVRHGGRIVAKSAPGQGTTFTFELEAQPRRSGTLVTEVVIDSVKPWGDD